MWTDVLLARKLALFALVLLLSSCDSGASSSVSVEDLTASINAPSSATTAESFEVIGNAHVELSDGRRGPVDSLKLFFQGDLIDRASGDVRSVSAIIGTTMTAPGNVTAVVRAWKTVEGGLLSDDASQVVKIIEAPPQNAP